MRVLEIESRFDGDKAAQGFEDIGRSAQDMARTVDSATSKADSAASRLDRVGESADNLDSKSAQATGSLGALSSGFELVGLEKYAMGLQSAAMATDFFAGVGEGLNLITQLSIVQRARDAAMAVRQAVANRAAAAATRVQAVAQRLLNIAMRANPIGLVITAVLLLVGLLIALYRRNERVRTIINAVGRAGRAALGWVVDKARELVGWIGNRIPGGFSTVKRAAELYIRLATLPMRTLIGVIERVVGWLRDRLPGAFRGVRDTASRIAEPLLRPFRSLLDFIDRIIDAIARIDFPSPPKWLDRIPGLGRTVAGAGGGPVAATVVVQGIVSDRLVRDIEVAQANALRRVGVVR